MLEVKDLSVNFGGIVALDGISFAVGRGQICGLIGPNGAGKTTLFNCLSRLYRPTGGAIRFEGVDLLQAPAHRIAKLGIGRTFQNVALFKSLTVIDNVKLGASANARCGFLSHSIGLPSVAREEADISEAAWSAIGLVGLVGEAELQVTQLNFATQKKVELARALVTRPKLLLLDEPAGGLNHEEVSSLVDLLRSLRETLGLSILLVEHHLNLVMRVSDKVVALNFGRKIADGPPLEVQQDAAVVKAYLGTAN